MMTDKEKKAAKRLKKEAGDGGSMINLLVTPKSEKRNVFP